MSRYKGGRSAKSVERDFPHFINIVVLSDGLGTRLSAMYDFRYDFRARHGIVAKCGHRRRVGGAAARSGGASKITVSLIGEARVRLRYARQLGRLLGRRCFGRSNTVSKRSAVMGSATVVLRCRARRQFGRLQARLAFRRRKKDPCIIDRPRGRRCFGRRCLDRSDALRLDCAGRGQVAGERRGASF